MRITLAILASCLSSHAVAKGFSPSNANQYCMYAIYESFSPFKWQENSSYTSAVSQSSTRSSSASGCTNMLEVASIYASMRAYCHGRAYTVGLDFWKSLCTNGGSALMDLNEIEAIATTKYIEQLPVFSPGASNSASISSAVLLDKSYYRRAVRSVTADETDDSRSLKIAWGIHGFWGLVILVGIIFNFLTGLFYCRDAEQTQDPEKPRSPSPLRRLSASNPITKVYNALNTHLILAPSLGTNGTLAYQIWDTMGPRLGLLAFACLPWLWVFAGRNNVLIWATGWSFHTFNVFHRHLAILTILFAIIHSISYTVKYLAYSETLPLQPSPFRLTSRLKTRAMLMCLMIPFSCGAVRKRFYEVFLVVHVLFGIVIVYALFRHMSKFGAEYTPHLWPVVAIWSFDRLVRLLRLALCNLPIHRSSSVHSPYQSTVTYHPSSDVLQIEIQPAILPTSPKAGHYYYIYQPTTFRGWENHPFTTASVRYSDRDSSSTSPFPGSTTPPRTSTEKEAAITTQSRPLPLPSLTASTPTLTFWVRPYTGWTHRLKAQAIAAGNTLHPTLVLEGPYGRSASTALRTFNRIVMIMGGTGIGVATAYLQVLLSAPQGLEHPQIDLHWTVREPALVDQLYRAELGSYLQCPGVRMRFYCSRGSCDAVEGDGVLSGGDVNVEEGRAPIAQIVAQAGAEEGSVAVVVCGPAEMADLTRAATLAARRGGAIGMEYFEEAYGW
ncbi:hypothetical protein ASPACDRAFT_1888264 [Aspergillus aculeatus ATCC 16872]|uniref:FAD-binding FR-type domain-containing protein n=1 Tax=Aspergillus aculeatus (strain ATCC 16872 / CBS 172.66 / WB 5094) TaxID=690307 RepID=A0A1L9WTL7_ASPA1|nr:uncharacterized protein ASPACDRAFT_1888264 [Aspergillus aculeatus ATCC 16872]OJJ99554.1 hypothetical protein ASPACDRAFT_1888264 [Aspergillus aculeatus ATCC 16872]